MEHKKKGSWEKYPELTTNNKFVDDIAHGKVTDEPEVLEKKLQSK